LYAKSEKNHDKLWSSTAIILIYKLLSVKQTECRISIYDKYTTIY